ncbi:MAG: malectin domain-containing carbohydrate-binding protein, partial [Candidatus Acidiferrales bacterium]
MLTHSRIAPRGQAKSFCSRLSAGVACACITALLIAGVLLLAPSAGAQNWTLVWSDEFNGPAGSIPSSSIWSFKDKGTNSNGEVEVYCAPTDNVAPCSTATPNVFEDGNGNMVMRAMNVGGTWTSARFNTSLSELPQYGRIEARMKLTVGDGLWPAFWMLGQDILTGTPWPTCGEIDIMEWVPQDAATSTTGTEHGPGYSGCCGTGNAHYTFPNGGRIDDAGYHTYGVVWLQNSIQWYRDDPTNVFFTVTSSDIPTGDAWVFNQPFYIIFNQAVGGNYPTPGPDSSTPNPSDVLVDYVRVYSASACTAPTVPTGLAATAASSTEINLSWTASTSSDCTVTYSVFRSTTSGFTPSTSNQVASNVTNTTYSDNGLASSTTYYYVVEATDYGNTTAPSNQAGATTSALGTQLLAIDTGSTTTVSPFVADEDFTGGTTSTHANTINTSNVKNPAPAAVYQTDRVGNFSYTIGGFTAGTNYVVRLHFCETYFTSAGSRTFNVSINGAQVLTDFDIYATAGGQNIANIQQFTEPANSSGQFVITFTSVVNNSFLAGIEIDSASASCSTPSAPSGLTATAASSSQINLSWTASSSSCSVTYNVFRSTTSGFTPSTSNQIATGVTTTSYSDTGLAGSTTYYYLVEGTNIGGTSAASNQASATTPCSAPTAPSGLTATAASSSQINLSWTASSSSCSVTYNVFRSTTSGFTAGSGNQIATGVTTTTYSNTGLAASTTYYYLVEGTSSGGTSAASNQASATTSAGSSGSCTSICIDSGSTTAVSPFVADEDFTGGTTINHANTIDTSHVT